MYFGFHPASYSIADHYIPQQMEYNWVGENLFPNACNAARSGREEVLLPQVFKGSCAHFVTFSLPWKRVPGSELVNQYPALDPSEQYWRIQSRDIILANLKPLFKLEKKASAVEYSIEKMNVSFEYDDFLSAYVFTPPRNNSSGFLLQLEPSSGSIDFGSTKACKVEITDPERSLWNQSYKIWGRIDSQPTQAIRTKYLSATSQLSAAVEWPSGQAEEFRQKANCAEREPSYLEQVFKVTFKNGYRFVEPKGPQLPEEIRVFYVKINVNP